MDSPCFHDAASGNRMVQKREARFAQMYGFAGNSLACEGYLTDDQRRSLSRGLDVRWKTIQPAPTWRQAGRQVRSLVRGHGEVATFPLLVATRRGRVDDSSGACSLGSRARRWLGREIQRWRFRLFQQRRLSQIVVEEVAGRPILVLPHVFNPKVFRSGAFLAESLSANLIPERSAVLDLGTGSGVAAIAAAEWADHIVGVDVNPVAVRCARLNALLNYAEGQIEIREGDLFSPVAGERFDVILFNPPYYRGEPRDLADRAWRSVDVVERFAAELPRYLTSAGRALVALSTDGETNAFLDCFRQCNLAIDVVAERVTLNETFTLYSLRTYA